MECPNKLFKKKKKKTKGLACDALEISTGFPNEKLANFQCHISDVWMVKIFIKILGKRVARVLHYLTAKKPIEMRQFCPAVKYGVILLHCG